MKTLARISLVALIMARLAAPASAATTAAPAQQEDPATYGRPRLDWCAFPSSPWCDRSTSWWWRH